MKKFLFLLCLVGPLTSSVYAAETVVGGSAAPGLSSYAKAGGQYLFSMNGVKDITAVGGLLTLMILIHELGHAVVAKTLSGAPVDVVMGGPEKKTVMTDKNTAFGIGGVKFAGFNFLNSHARWEERFPCDKKHYNASGWKDTAMLMAGPLAQALTCIWALKLLKNKENFWLTRAFAWGGLIDTIVGYNGLYGAINCPESDAYKIVGNFKNHLSQ